MGINAPSTPMREVSMEAAAQMRRVVPSAEVLSKRGGSSKPIPEEITRGQKHAAELRQFDQEHKDPAETVRASIDKSVRPLSNTELAQLDKVDKKLATEARQFGTYTEIMAEARKTGADPMEIAQKRNIPDFDITRTSVVDRMTRLDIFQEIPGFSGMDAEQQRVFVEESFGSNPRVRAIYIQEMRAISREAMGLPEDQTARNTGEKARGDAERSGLRNLTIDRMRARLGEKGKNLTNEQVQQMFTGGRDVSEVRMQLFDTLLDQNNVPASLVRQRDSLQAEADTIDTQIRSIDAQIQAKSGDKAVLDEQKKALAKRLAETRRTLGSIVITQEQEVTINEVNRAVYGTRDFRAGGALVGGVDAELTSIHNSFRAEQSASGTAPLSPEQELLQQQGEQLRTELQDRMENALQTSVENTLVEQIDESRSILERKMLAETAEKTEAEKTNKDRALVRMAEQQSHNWIGMDKEKGTRTINYEVIGQDARYLASEGQEGVKRLMLRDLMLGGEGAIIRMNGADGAPLIMSPEGKLLNVDGTEYKITVQQRTAEGEYKPIVTTATWENIPYESLPQESRDLLTTLHQEQGNSYAARLIMDLEQARHPHSIKETWKVLGNLKTLNLTRDEVASLHTKLGGALTEGVQKAHEADDILERLRERGINVTSKDKMGMRILLMLLAMFGLGGFKKKES